MNALEYKVYPLKAYELGTNLHLYSIAWDECIELQVSDKQTWFEWLVQCMYQSDRWEITVEQDGFAIGGLILSPDRDVHVGKCMAVGSQYVVPEHRNKGVSIRLMREAVRIARREGYSMLAYTHRVGDWRYKTIYRKI